MSDLITEIVNCRSNDLSIWDPSPNALRWCVDGPISTASSLVASADAAEVGAEAMAGAQLELEQEVAVSNKAYVEGNPPIVIEDDIGICNDWTAKPSMPHMYDETVLANTVPTYSSGDTKFRFIIITAGPPGSGKSVMNENIKKGVKLINFRAFNKEWNHVGHDDIVCRDPTFITGLKEISDKIKKGDYRYEDIYNNINDKGDWYDLMVSQNQLYNDAKSWSKTEMTKLEKREFGKNVALSVYNSVSGDKSKHSYLSALLRTSKHDKFKELNAFIFEQLPDDMTRLYNEKSDLYPINTIKDYNSFDNDIMLYIITTLSVLFGFNFTYETTLNTTDSLSFIFETCTELTNKCNDYNYIFVMGFPLVNFENLIQRVIKRYLVWHNDRNVCSVGLPMIDKDTYFKKITNTYLNVASYIYHCNLPDECNGVTLDYLYLFDNNGDIPTDSYDVVRLSKRALIITPETAKYKRMAGSYTKTIIAIIMKALTSFKQGISHELIQCEGDSCIDDNGFLVSRTDVLFDGDAESKDVYIENIKQHQDKLQSLLRETEQENIGDYLRRCIHRMEQIKTNLSEHEIKRQCMISKNRFIKMSKIQESPARRTRSKSRSKSRGRHSNNFTRKSRTTPL